MKINSLFIILSFLLVSCQSKDEKSKGLCENLKHDDSQQTASDNSIVLNNGEKWLINNEMVLPITNIELKNYSLFFIY